MGQAVRHVHALEARTRRLPAWPSRWLAAVLPFLLPVLLPVLVGGGRSAAAAARESEPLVVSAPLGPDYGEHLWIVVWQPEATPLGGARPGWAKGVARILHAPPEAPGTMRIVAEQSVAPIAIAAYGDRLWTVQPPSTSFPDSRDIVVRRIEWNPATKLSFALPPAGELMPGLPAGGELVGLAADQRGLWALITPPPAVRFGVQRDGASEAASTEAERSSRLLWLRRDAWVEVPMPPELARADGLTVGREGIAVLAPVPPAGPGTADADAGTGTLIGTPSGPALFPSSRVPPAEIAATWSVARVAVPRRVAGRPVEWFEANDRWACAKRVEGDPRLVELSYAIDGREVAWADVRFADDPFAVVAGGSGAVAVAISDPPSDAGSQALPVVERSRVSRSASVADPFQRLTAPGFGAAYWLHIPLLLMMAMGALMIFAFVRVIASPEQARQPLDVAALPLDRRIGALFIDALPPAILVLLLFRVPPSELLYLPSWTVDFPRALPAVLTIAGTCLHTGIAEWLSGATLGKRLVRARVVAADGSRPTLLQVVLRGAFKALVLAAPILSVFVLLHRDRRGIGDIASGTVVIDTAPPTEGANERRE